MSSNAVLVGKDVYVVDAGEGLLHRLAAAGLQVDQVQSVFITHHHFDHNADLGPLIGFRWLARQYSPLPVIGPPMTRQMVEDQARAYRPMELAPITIGGPSAPPIASTVAARDLPSELDEPAVIWQQGALTVTAVLNDHYHFEEGSEAARLARSYAMRFETPSRTVVFTGDTGPSRRVEGLARGADLLVSEVIDLDRIAAQWRQNKDVDPNYVEGLIAHLAEDHLSPEEVGKLAARAGVKRVVLTHLVPGWDEETDPDIYSRGVTQHFDGPVHVANDLDRF
jgi:ribonuclease BN (tRNA processing enzyme)